MYTNRRRRVGPILQTTRDGQSDRRARRSKMTDALLVSDGQAGVPLDVAVDPAQLLCHPGVHPGGGGLKISEK